jgi:hypothetical protein
MLTRLILIVVLLLGCSMAVTAKPHARARRFDLTRAVGCLMSRDWVKDDLRDVELRQRMIAPVRYRLGSIPGTSPNSSDQFQIIIYSPDRKHARLYPMYLEKHDRFGTTHNAYNLTLSDGEWVASEGNGGVATYEAVRKYANSMAKQRAVLVRLVADSRGCLPE